MTDSMNKRHGDLEVVYKDDDRGDRGLFEIVRHWGENDSSFVASINTTTAEVELDHLLTFSVDRLPVFLALCRYARAHLRAEEELGKAFKELKPKEDNHA